MYSLLLLAKTGNEMVHVRNVGNEPAAFVHFLSIVLVPGKTFFTTAVFKSQFPVLLSLSLGGHFCPCKQSWSWCENKSFLDTSFRLHHFFVVGVYFWAELLLLEVQNRTGSATAILLPTKDAILGKTFQISVFKKIEKLVKLCFLCNVAYFNHQLIETFS